MSLAPVPSPVPGPFPFPFPAGDAAELLDRLVRGELPDARGRFGPFGGRFVPETLVPALERLEREARAALSDPEFRGELARELRDWVGRPTPLTHAAGLSRRWACEVWLKREDLAHTGAHKINNALGQALLARRIGVRRVVAETGAGQHGVATAASCARLGLPCRVYMGAVDVARQAPNVDRMRRLGAEVVAVEAGDATLRAAIDEALRDWVGDPEGVYYLLGSAVGPHPYPWLVRELQSVIGREARAQLLERAGRLPDAAIACVGGGSNAIGLFHPFLADAGVRLFGIEAGGRGPALGEHAATIAHGRPGVLHGSCSLLLHDAQGQVVETHSVSAGLDYPGVGPEHALLAALGRVVYSSVDDDEAVAALDECCAAEGILPALETSHAFAGARRFARENPGALVLIGVSGRGDKDLPALAALRTPRAGFASLNPPPQRPLATVTLPSDGPQKTRTTRTTIEEAVAGARAAGRPALAAYLTAGLPSSAVFEELLGRVAQAADVVEVGIPFSDPMADGVTIQRASRHALEQGASLELALAILRRSTITRPVVVMSYLNPLLAFGLARLPDALADAGVAGLVVPDLPLEEGEDVGAALAARDIALVPLAAPATTDDRLRRLGARARGFIYAVAVNGVTGGSAGAAGGEDDTALRAHLDRVRAVARVPVLAGFGIRTAEQVRRIAPHADGVIVGSALIEQVESGADPVAFLRSLLAAVRP